MSKSLTANALMRCKVITLSLGLMALVTVAFSQSKNSNLPTVKTSQGKPLISSTEKETKKTEKKEAPPNAQAAMRKALPKEFAELFPIGRVFKGVNIPSYEKNALESVMNSEIVERVSKNHINFTNLIFFFYNSTGKPTTSIQMDKAQYHLQTGILSSKTPANIEQERFTMRGDHMTFETDSHLAQLDGDVRMLIFEDNIINTSRDADAKGTIEITATKSVMDNENREITFIGNVLVRNKKDKVTMKCDKLEVFLVSDGEEVKDASGKQSKISRAIATGQMIEIKKIDEEGKEQIALARMAHYDAITKDAFLSGGPPCIQDGKGNFVSTKSRDAQIVLRNGGSYEIIGSEPHTITISGDGKSSGFSFGEGIN